MPMFSLILLLVFMAGCAHEPVSASGPEGPTPTQARGHTLPAASSARAQPEPAPKSEPTRTLMSRCRRDAALEACRSVVSEAARPYEERLAAQTVLCDANLATACLDLSTLLLMGDGEETPGSPGAARRIDARVCGPQAALATPDAKCLRHVHMVREGVGGTKDLERAGMVSAWLCEAEIEQACTVLADLIDAGDVEPAEDEPRREVVRKLYERAAAQGDGEAMARLGERALWGVDAPQDRAMASAHFERACQADNTRGCARLGLVYQFGLGVERDFARAAEHYARACEGGDVPSCVSLGHLTEAGIAGEGVEQAVELYASHCEAGGMEACLNLGFMYEHGRGVPRDEARARVLYVQACKGGEEGGCHRLMQQD